MAMKKLIIAATLLAAIGTPARADLMIGWAGPVTGGSAAVGEQNLNGVKQAVEDINAAGGILGEKVVLQIEDDAGDPKQAVSVANRLAASGILFVIGHQNSGASIPASDVYAENGMLRTVEHVPHLWPRRPAGHYRRQLPGEAIRREERLPHSRQDALRPGLGRGGQENH
jgi:hypothetical protein